MNRHIINTSIFVVVVVLSGWIGVLVDHIIGGPTQRETLGMTVWLVLPLLATILLRIFAKDGWKETGFKLNVKGNVRYYISSICIFPIVMLIVCFVGYAFGWIDLSNFKGTELSSSYIFFMYVVTGSIAFFLISFSCISFLYNTFL